MKDEILTSCPLCFGNNNGYGLCKKCFHSIKVKTFSVRDIDELCSVIEKVEHIKIKLNNMKITDQLPQYNDNLPIDRRDIDDETIDDDTREPEGYTSDKSNYHTN